MDGRYEDTTERERERRREGKREGNYFHHIHSFYDLIQQVTKCCLFPEKKRFCANDADDDPIFRSLKPCQIMVCMRKVRGSEMNLSRLWFVRGKARRSKFDAHLFFLRDPKLDRITEAAKTCIL